MKNTKIEWAHHTFSPWIGCTKISPACDNCYAEKSMPAKMLGVQWGVHAERRRTSEANWKQPLRWNAEAEKLGVRYRVFCASLADVFDNAVPPDWRVELFRLIEMTPHLDWLLLTKRIGNAEVMINDACSDIMRSWREPWPNVWLGATICNQEEADRDTPKLLAVPAAKRFLSLEPLLGPVKLRWEWVSRGRPLGGGPSVNLLEPWKVPEPEPAIEWAIVGGESGSNARPMHPDWVRSLRDQCAAAGVPFFFKQWGEWEVASTENGHHDCDMSRNGAVWLDYNGTVASPSSLGLNNPYAMIRVGKKTAGRLLDGREWSEVPK